MKKTTLGLEYAELWFKQSIWFHARRFETGIWSAEDIVQEVLLHIANTPFAATPTKSRYHGGRLCKVNPAQVIVAIRRKCLKIRRHESYRLRCGEPSVLTPDHRSDPTKRAEIREALLRLTERQARLVRAMVSPKRPPAPRRNVTLRQAGAEAGVSVATASRAMAEARKLLETALHVNDAD